ncbi:SSU ribosomal protein S2p [Vibrio cholerae]|nr:SSU ribosomal protein S2p [Vibrio cholerae]GHW99810.1 SSU ribosomal protein S2p [Vibrio cholerae]GHX42582.1 SSU ribosomal protein S2p [Vibrio cholerae]
MPIYDIFDKTKLYRCPFWKDPITCTCSSCHMRREWEKSSAALKAAEARNFASLGSSVPSVQSLLRPEPIQETTREKVERQRKERQEQSEKDWAKLQDQQKNAEEFMLGWMQNTVTQPQAQLWTDLFTAETSEEQKQFIKQCNVHLNNPVREGEIVIVPTTKPTSEQEKKALADLQEDAQAASTELAKLTDEQVATVNRHLELLDYYANQAFAKIKQDGLPSDYYAYASLGVGMATAGVEQRLKNISDVLLEINDLYASQVAMASRTGGINYGPFVAERAELFKKLDGSFAGLSKRSVKLPIYTQVKRNLKLSTKSVIHNADEILKTGFVKNLGKRIANVSIGITAAKGVGYVGLVLGAASGVNNIYEACKVDSTGNCGKTTSVEIGGFIGGLVVGGKLATWAVGGALLLVGTASAPVVAVASIGAFIAGGSIGGIMGSTAGKFTGEIFYEWITE